MENLPLIILGSVGFLLVVFVFLYVMFLKKQDKKDSEQAMDVLENLSIEFKSASEDADELILTEELEEQTSPVDDVLPEQPEKQDQSEKPDDEHDSASATGFLDGNEEYLIEKEGTTALPGLDDTSEEPDEEFLEKDDEFEIVKDYGIKGQESEKKEKKDVAVGPDNDIFEMMNNQNELVIEPEDELSIDVDGDEFDLDAYMEDALKIDAAHSDDTKTTVSADIDDDIDELEALFQASHSVEEKLLSPDTPSKTGTSPDKTPQQETPVTAHPEPDTRISKATSPKEPDTVKRDTSPVDVAAAARQVKADEPPEADVADTPRFDPENQKRHDKAKRIARVIVNDIRNYNPENLAEGIRIGNIMKTLGKEVERGRLLYIKRVPHDIVKETNYYREALVNILADGHPELLGF